MNIDLSKLKAIKHKRKNNKKYYCIECGWDITNGKTYPLCKNCKDERDN